MVLIYVLHGHDTYIILNLVVSFVAIVKRLIYSLYVLYVFASPYWNGPKFILFFPRKHYQTSPGWSCLGSLVSFFWHGATFLCWTKCLTLTIHCPFPLSLVSFRWSDQRFVSRAAEPLWCRLPRLEGEHIRVVLIPKLLSRQVNITSHSSRL